jgi:metal-dependent HD superfamily phosphatase/phosphodiesterase
MTDSNIGGSSSAEPKYGTTGIDPDSVTEEARTHASIPFQTVKDDPEIQAMIAAANRNLGVMGFTEHGFRHVGLVSNIARNIMARLGYDQRHQELAAIAGYTHDIGNVISRHGHASTGAILAHQILTRMGMDPADVIVVMGAIGSHGDDAGKLGEPVHPVSAALILADKSDVHRTRVRNMEPAAFDDHDQMNYATTSSFLRVDPDAKNITLELQIDTEMASVMKYFELFMPRMQMCRRAANLLDQTFRITINDVAVL